MKWVQGAGWTGFGFDINPADNMTAVWGSDSVKFRMKAQAGTEPCVSSLKTAPPKEAQSLHPRPTVTGIPMLSN